METLYRFFDKEGQLLYVGISNNWKTRFHQHERNAEWWDDVTHAFFEKYETRELVEAAEKTVILTENPIWNKAHSLTYESPRQHFERIKSMIRYNNADALHNDFVQVLRDAIVEDHNQPYNCKAQYVAAAFIDNYGFPKVDCRNCEAINNSKYFLDLSNLGWKNTNAK